MRRLGTHDYVFGRELAFGLQLRDPGFDIAQPLRLDRERLLHVVSSQEQHVAQLCSTDLGVEDLSYLIEVESQFFQYEDAVQLRQLRDGVVAVSALRVGMCRSEQADFIVEPQQA